MRTWHTADDASEQLQILQIGSEQVGEKAKWGPGRRNFYIVHYVLDGKGYFNGVPVEKGQGFLIYPMKSVEYHPDTEKPWQYFWISFQGGDAQRICNKHIKPDENGVFSYDFRTELIRLLRELQTKENLLGPMCALSVFYQVMSCHEMLLPMPRNRYVAEAMRFINLNFHRQLTVEEIASACGINDRYLYNLFVRYLDISPKQYLNQVRIQTAQQLLRDSSCTVTEAAFSVGFEDVLAFSRFFSKHTGLSPTAFRSRSDGLTFDK